MRTIAIVNAKGGCGKTTIATSLAAALAWEGHAVALGDMDPQQSATDWLALRPEEYPEIIPAEPHKGQLRAPPESDTLVLDTPAAVGSHELNNIVRRSQTILVPVLPSPVDMRSAWRFLNHLLDLKPVKKGHVRVGLVANRVKPYTIIFRELTGFLDDFRVPVVGQLRDSMNYVRAFERGLTVSDLPPYLAWTDWEQWEEIMSWIRSKKSVGKG
ncbi:MULTISPECIES: ParA family protein [unclassified Wenzhouxiangella]|uniref:ParA family protein n=1 Tax=unclassified Wenzhouxiangella TaxID=2613841 RepID=UPI000E329793|nr:MULTISPECIES: ParA family protein [unclassified Wenzhouxiangella]RFF26599.1 ParA family protein [Wenzhouxiangella sp. 15181]RFP67652.1 ParA family protein [Wenzhouxiangella sp. 15190]